MRDEQKRKLLSQIHVLADPWRPFMAEISLLFADFQRPRPLKARRAGSDGKALYGSIASAPRASPIKLVWLMLQMDRERCFRSRTPGPLLPSSTNSLLARSNACQRPRKSHDEGLRSAPTTVLGHPIGRSASPTERNSGLSI
jgi:hypothetical protein